MSDKTAVVAFVPCYVHGGIFTCNPDLVTTVLVDPVTGYPPDVEPDPATPALGVRMARSGQRFICQPCCGRLNQEVGYEKFPRLDDGKQVIA